MRCLRMPSGGAAGNEQKRRIRGKPGREGLAPPGAMNARGEKCVVMTSRSHGEQLLGWGHKDAFGGQPSCSIKLTVRSGSYWVSPIGSEVMIDEPKAWIFLEKKMKMPRVCLLGWGACLERQGVLEVCPLLVPSVTGA